MEKDAYQEGFVGALKTEKLMRRKFAVRAGIFGGSTHALISSSFLFETPPLGTAIVASSAFIGGLACSKLFDAYKEFESARQTRENIENIKPSNQN